MIGTAGAQPAEFIFQFRKAARVTDLPAFVKYSDRLGPRHFAACGVDEALYDRVVVPINMTKPGSADIPAKKA